jgi:hypothetical protein
LGQGEAFQSRRFFETVAPCIRHLLIWKLELVSRYFPGDDG